MSFKDALEQAKQQAPAPAPQAGATPRSIEERFAMIDKALEGRGWISFESVQLGERIMVAIDERTAEGLEKHAQDVVVYTRGELWAVLGARPRLGAAEWRELHKWKKGFGGRIMVDK